MGPEGFIAGGQGEEGEKCMWYLHSLPYMSRSTAKSSGPRVSQEGVGLRDTWRFPKMSDPLLRVPILWLMKYWGI